MLASLPFFGLIGVALGSATSFSLPFLRMGLREGVLLKEGRVAYKVGIECNNRTQYIRHPVDQTCGKMHLNAWCQIFSFMSLLNQITLLIKRTFIAGPGGVSSNTWAQMLRTFSRWEKSCSTMTTRERSDSAAQGSSNLLGPPLLVPLLPSSSPTQGLRIHLGATAENIIRVVMNQQMSE